MRNKLISGVMALVVAAAVYVTFFAPSDKKQIGDVVKRFAKSVRVSEDDNPIVRGARIHGEFGETLREDVHVTVPDLPNLHQGRADLETSAAQGGVLYRTAAADLGPIEIKIDDAHKSAKAGATVLLRGTRRDGEELRSPRAVDFLLSKDDQKWKITSVTVWSEGSSAVP